MKIVVLDGHTANPGDLDWQKFEDLGALKVYDWTVPEEAAQHAQSADILLTNKTVIDETVISQCPSLKYIGVLATGYNVVDIDAATRAKVIVCNVPAYSTASVAQHTFALILTLAGHVESHSQQVQNGKWTQCKDFCFWDYPIIELAGKTMGLVGYGNIGQKVARIAQSFDMKVKVCRQQTHLPAQSDVAYTDFQTLVATSDMVSLHCPLTDETRHIMNESTLKLMKPTAWLINTARGPLIDEQALANALKFGQIAGAAVDVLSSEPPKANNPLLSAPNIYITPHLAWASIEARTRLLNVACENIRAFLAGNPVNVVNEC